MHLSVLPVMRVTLKGKGITTAEATALSNKTKIAALVDVIEYQAVVFDR